MKNILIISASVRTGRKSDRVVAFFKQKLMEKRFKVTMADLKEYDFPLFQERLKFLNDPLPGLTEYAQKVSSADGILIITPEYNGGIPSSLKNAIDVLNDEWKGKPVALASVSNGNFGASQVLVSLLFSLWKMGTWVVPASFQVANVDSAFDETGNPENAEGTNKRADAFLEKFFWHIEANSLMRSAGG